MRERRREYELMVIISPVRSTDEEITASLDRIKTTVSNLGGEVTSTETGTPWGRRKFAYPIRAYTEGEASRRPFTEGYYALMLVQLSTARFAEFERQLRLNDTVLRYMCTLVEHKAAKAPAAEAPEDAEVVAEGE